MAFIDPKIQLEKGVAILEPLMRKYGFVFSFGETGKGSGGTFASGKFSHGERSIILWFRYELGSVTYKIGTIEISHEELIRGQDHKNAYPGFGSDSIQAFQDVLSDLEKCGQAFFNGTERNLELIKSNFENKYKSVKGLP